MAVLVSMENVSKIYRRGDSTVYALRDVGLEIHRGDFIAITGPSGSGKSTLLNLLSGLDRTSQGVLSVDGRNISTMSPRALARWRATNVGFVFQFYNLLPALSAAANVEIPLYLTKLSRAERARHVELALGLVGLLDRKHHKPTELSGGQQQRVAIARAIVSDATMIVCDEPTGDLDRENADAVMELLLGLNQQHGKTIITVTHDPQAAAYARREIRLDKGQLASAREVATA